MHKITAFIISEANKIKKTGKEVAQTTQAKSAPHYFGKSVPTQFIIGREKIILGNKEISLTIKKYHPDAVLVEGTVEVSNIFEEDVLDIKDKIHNACHELAKKNGSKEVPTEEYTVYQVSGYKGGPEQFLSAFSNKIASILKSERLPLDEKEVEYTLSFNFKYGKNDLTIVDWDGAFVFDPEGEFGEEIELFQLANYQLLKYRVLDEDLDERTEKISKVILSDKIKLFRLIPDKEVTDEFRGMIKLRTRSIAQFESLERNIKLIGDWYSARLYDLLSKKFRLEGWRDTVKEKMDSLEDIYTIAAENLGMSKMQRLELIQIWAFFILQIGWLTILILEFFYYTK